MRKYFVKLILFFLLAPLLVFGQEKGLVPCSGLDCELCHIFELLANITSFFLISVIPPVAALLFVYGGVMFYVAGGDSGKVAQARKILVSVVVGIVIVYSAHFLISALLGVLGAGEVNWPDIDFC